MNDERKRERARRWYHRHKSDPGFAERRAAYEARPDVRERRNARAATRQRTARAAGRNVSTYNRDATLRLKYGIGEDDYAALYAAAGGRCGVCAEGRDILDVDHDHATGRIRGLLCGRCNRALGLLRDDPVRLMAAAAYISAAA